ncbi:MAG: co-chaperone GroES [Peptococcaceae bacterium]|nr:co-chaperone GroES [Peptococcaceae bacterium]MEE0205451.1 co-chaperone GroES [Peptococcaceae bacterium]
MNIKPLGDKVVVKPAKAEEKTESGIILPGSAQEKPHQGTVVAVGPGARDDKGNHIPLDVKEGDRVIYGKFGGVDLKYDNEEYVVLSEKDILVVLD